jgi:hypothetical protein
MREITTVFGQLEAVVDTKIPKDLVKQTDSFEDTFIDENAGNSDHVHLQDRVSF